MFDAGESKNNGVLEIDIYEKHEKNCIEIRKVNDGLINEFGVWLKDAGLSVKTINQHLSNIDFYVNVYLLNEDTIEAKDGADKAGLFLGFWFIKKAMWASEKSIKGNAASIKKFYTFMHEKGLVDK